VTILRIRMTPLVAGVLALSIASVAPVAAQTSTSVDSLALGRRWTTWLYNNHIDSLIAAHPSSVDANAVRDMLAGRREELLQRAGKEVTLVSETFIKRNGQTQYWRTATFSNPSIGEPIMIRWAVNKSWQIIGLGINPASAAPPVDKP
jgi:hypothetical protein